MSKTIIHAYTEPHSDYPAYVNLSERPDGQFALTVRSQGDGGRNTGTIYLSRAQLMDLVDNASEHLDADPQATKDAAAKSLMAAEPSKVDNPGLRAHALEMALRTPGVGGHHDVLRAAAAYQAHIAGMMPIESKTYADGTKATGPAPLPDVSPVDTSDAAIEREIVAKGKTAPRVTPADIEANIASEHYFTAADGATSRDAVNSEGWQCAVPAHLKLLTLCVLVLQNGFTVTGESACASPENFDAEIGRKIARENAVQKIWPLTPSLQPHQQRVVDERAELDARADRLGAFIEGPVFDTLPEDERTRLSRQHGLMRDLSDVLSDRIAAFAAAAPRLNDGGDAKAGALAGM
jgi:hypothetical protein